MKIRSFLGFTLIKTDKLVGMLSEYEHKLTQDKKALEFYKYEYEDMRFKLEKLRKDIRNSVLRDPDTGRFKKSN